MPNKVHNQITPERKQMTPAREQHLQRIKAAITSRIDSKYRRGQIEHGGDLFMKPVDDLLEDAMDEIADLVVYLSTLREAIERARDYGA